ncbi:hypothetical protein ACFLRT_03085, partial [Acidobacteriota bacterium]
LLKAPDLLERILKDFEKCGVVGEQTNKLVGYLAAVSRKLDNPLAILIQSSSAAGKTWLMECACLYAGGRKDQILSHDRTVFVLHEGNRYQTQNPCYSGRRRGGTYPVCVKAASK